MCVLVYKPAGVELPSFADLYAMKKANPDGFGFATTSGRMFKTTDYDTFFARLLANVGKDDAAILHFRWATHGRVKDSNCHPFKKGNFILAHNGVLSIQPKKGRTDTEQYFIELYPKLKKYGLTSRVVHADLKKNAGTFNKIAIIDTTTQKVKLYGNFESYKGCYFSNLRWMCHRPAPFTNLTPTSYFCDCSFQ